MLVKSKYNLESIFTYYKDKSALFKYMRGTQFSSTLPTE